MIENNKHIGYSQNELIPSQIGHNHSINYIYRTYAKLMFRRPERSEGSHE